MQLIAVVFSTVLISNTIVTILAFCIGPKLPLEQTWLLAAAYMTLMFVDLDFGIYIPLLDASQSGIVAISQSASCL